jgi:hypothetical protein
VLLHKKQNTRVCSFHIKLFTRVCSFTTLYIRWPDDYLQEAFIITTYGEDKLNSALQQMAKMKQQLNGKPIQIKRCNAVNEIEMSHIIYVSPSKISDFQSILSKFTSQPVLIITEAPGLAEKGAAINFVEQGGKIKFELNERETDRRKLKVASQLKTLAILI